MSVPEITKIKFSLKDTFYPKNILDHIWQLVSCDQNLPFLPI